jgi:hypothetical protein
MERTQIFDLMGELKLYGMKAAFDEIMATAVKRQHESQRIVGDLLNAEINEKQVRSIKYQLTIAKLPLAKDIADFQFHARRSTGRSSTISPAAASSLSNVTSSWSAERAPARPIWPSPLPEAASGSFLSIRSLIAFSPRAGAVVGNRDLPLSTVTSIMGAMLTFSASSIALSISSLGMTSGHWPAA